MLIRKFIQILHPMSQLFSNAAWLFGAEIVAKVSRILTIIVLAVALTPISYGTAVLALACHEMLALMLRAGAGTQIIRCNDDNLKAFAKNGATIQWGICLTLACFQFVISHFIARWYDNPDLVMLLQVMAATYLFYPWVSIKIFLLQRENKMRLFSIFNGLCITAENLSIALFAWWKADFMAVAYGKIVFSVLWLVLFSFVPVKSFGMGFNWCVFKALLRTSGQLFSSEFLRALRLHIDTFIAAKVMTPELFGFYSFAKNAGVGLSQSIGNVFTSALYPFLCKLQRLQTMMQHQRLIYFVAFSVSLLFVFQSMLVPVYVPLLFDAKWQSMISLVSMMCFVAVPSMLVDTYCSIARAKAEFNREIVTRFLCLMISVLMLTLCSAEQPMEFANVMVISGILWCVTIYLGHNLIEKIANVLVLLTRRKPHEY